MNELRKDYLLDRWVIIAKERAKRPHDFKGAPKEISDPKKCFFCPGNEHTCPADISRVDENGHWAIRVIPNKFPAVKPEGDSEIHTDNIYYTFASAYGRHEVIIETDQHGVEFEDLEVGHIKKILKVYIERIETLSKDPNIDYVSIFKNKGAPAGASVSHTHSQVIAYNNIPSVVRRELDTSYDKYLELRKCPFCDIIDREKGSDRRIFEKDHTVAFTPYASRFPFEAWIFPRRHISGLNHMTEDEIEEFASSLKQVLSKLKGIGDIPYNIIYHTICDDSPNFHFHVEILPRLTTWAGFEMETGTIINPVPPEDAAKFYRGE